MYLRCNSPGPCARARAHISIGTRGSSRVLSWHLLGLCGATPSKRPAQLFPTYFHPIPTPLQPRKFPVLPLSSLSYTHIPECLECATHTAPPLLRVTRRQGKTRAGTCRCVCVLSNLSCESALRRSRLQSTHRPFFPFFSCHSRFRFDCSLVNNTPCFSLAGKLDVIRGPCVLAIVIVSFFLSPPPSL